MRVSKWSAVSLLATALQSLIVVPASGQSDASPTAEQQWQACIGLASAVATMFRSFMASAKRRELWVVALLCGIAGFLMIVNSHLLWM